jgi:hypothetical protein
VKIEKPGEASVSEMPSLNEYQTKLADARARIERYENMAHRIEKLEGQFLQVSVALLLLCAAVYLLTRKPEVIEGVIGAA